MKQTALQTLIEWGDRMMKEQPMKLLSFADAIDKAEELLEMEKEQIIDSFGIGAHYKSTSLIGYHSMAEQYYNETYKTHVNK